jgi:exonuclease SbcD
MRILLMADTHLGFDFPFRPRIQRRRRGEDFLANYKRSLQPAYHGKVDAIIHAGDLLFRSQVAARLVDMAFAPLKEIADLGVDVFIVPGNHERSRIPFRILSLHPYIHIFDIPRTFILEGKGLTIAVAGFPYWRDNVRGRFLEILEDTEWQQRSRSCDGAILCVHHCFEGATVGPGNYTFRSSDDVIRIREVPEEFCAVLSGHIHRFQVLSEDLQGKSITTPILYPSSIERTSFAEKDEPKGYLEVQLRKKERLNKEGMNKGEQLSISWKFIKLPVRPMVRVNIQAHGLSRDALEHIIRQTLEKLDPDSIVKIHLQGQVGEDALSVLRAESLRSLYPSQMNVSLRRLEKNLTSALDI